MTNDEARRSIKQQLVASSAHSVIVPDIVASARKALRRTYKALEQQLADSIHAVHNGGRATNPFTTGSHRAHDETIERVAPER